MAKKSKQSKRKDTGSWRLTAWVQNLPEWKKWLYSAVFVPVALLVLGWFVQLGDKYLIEPWSKGREAVRGEVNEYRKRVYVMMDDHPRRSPSAVFRFCNDSDAPLHNAKATVGFIVLQGDRSILWVTDPCRLPEIRKGFPLQQPQLWPTNQFR